MFMITTEASSEIVMEAIKAGAHNYLVKNKIDAVFVNKIKSHPPSRKMTTDPLNDSPRSQAQINDDSTEVYGHNIDEDGDDATNLHLHL